jgi:nicotinamide-nucleotide amidase
MVYNEQLINEIKDKLLANKESIAVAESVTSGNIQAALSLALDASKFFQGGITAYNLGQKARHLNIEPIHAEDANCISKNIAAVMALEVAKMFTADYGIGITGYASIVPQNEKEGLFAFVAVCYKHEVVVARRITSAKEAIYDVQVDYTNQALQLLHTWLKKK